MSQRIKVYFTVRFPGPEGGFYRQVVAQVTWDKPLLVGFELDDEHWVDLALAVFQEQHSAPLARVFKSRVRRWDAAA